MMNHAKVSQIDIENLILEIKQTSSFPEKILAVLNWSKNDMSKTLVCGTTWYNETTFFISHTQLAPLFGVKPDTILSSLKKHGFIKSYSPVPTIQKYIWSKPGFSMEGCSNNNEQSGKFAGKETVSITESQEIPFMIESESNSIDNQDTSINEPCTTKECNKADSSVYKNSKFGNEQFKQILSETFKSENIKCSDLIHLFYQLYCPSYVDIADVENTFKDYFYINIEKSRELYIDKESFWIFYQHFGPINSILAKYNSFKEFSTQTDEESQSKITINRSEGNGFLYMGRFHIFNDFNKEIGTFYLSDENGQFYESWNQMAEVFDKIPSDSRIGVPLPNYTRYPIPFEKPISTYEFQSDNENL